MRRKVELIQQIRAMESVPLIRTKFVDFTETGGQGLLSEMSVAEVSSTCNCSLVSAYIGCSVGSLVSAYIGFRTMNSCRLCVHQDMYALSSHSFVSDCHC